MSENYPSSDEDHRSFLLDLARFEVTEPSSSSSSTSSKKTEICTGPGQMEFQPPFPAQMLEKVLHFLFSRRDRNAASLVSKLWCRTEALTRSELFIGNCYAVSPGRATARFGRVLSVILKGKPRLAEFVPLPPNWGAHFSPWAAALAKAYPRLEKLHLKRMSVTDADLTLVAESFAGLRELFLDFCQGFSTRGLAAVAGKCRVLRVLELVGYGVEDADFDEVDWISCFPESQTHLESLVFPCGYCPVNFEALERLVARSPSLKKLELNRDVSISQLYRLMVRAPQLTHLGTGSFGASEAVAIGDQEADYASAFVACKSLVCLSGFLIIWADYLPAIYPVCPNLTSLNLILSTINADQFRSVICHCHKLQILGVNDDIRDEGLQAVAATCRDLRELRVMHPINMMELESPVSEVGFKAISESCRKLESILFYCQRMTNEALVTLSKNCPDLVVFRLRIIGHNQPDPVTHEPMDEGFGAILMNCKKLTRLAVSGLLTDRAFEYIGRYGKLIRTLSVVSAGDTDVGLKCVLEGCPNLQKLEIRDSPFGDGALRSGLHHYYNMRFLWMSSCKLTRPACREVARALPHLVLEEMYNEEDEVDDIDILYLYPSLDGPRDDAPKLVTILH